MAKKKLEKDKYGEQKVMNTSDYFADSLGQLQSSEAWCSAVYC